MEQQTYEGGTGAIPSLALRQYNNKKKTRDWCAHGNFEKARKTETNNNGKIGVSVARGKVRKERR